MSDTPRPQSWITSLCLLLFLATFLNYADRVVFTQNSVLLKQHFQTDDAGYGRAEGAFGYGFALGGLLFGVVADWVSIRWLYPGVVLAWSLAGYGSTQAEDLSQFVWWRAALGLFEAGHWPCALRMTQRSFPPRQRTWGNGILQSGAAAGQILLPIGIGWLSASRGDWRPSFVVAAAGGVPWVFAWLALVREADVRRPALQVDESAPAACPPREIQEIAWYRIFLLRRWWLLLLTVICINVPWHALRVWMPDTLRTYYGYDQAFVDSFTALYYLSALVGSLSTGWIIEWLAARGWNVHRARLAAFGLCAASIALLAPAMLLPAGGFLLAIQLLAAYGTLGVAPIYYSLNQELSGRAQGKVGGSLSFLLWCVLGWMQGSIGKLVKSTPDARPLVFAGVAVLPLLALVGLVWGWGRTGKSATAADHD